MVKRSRDGNKLGGWAFLIGVVLAVVLGLFGPLGANWVWLFVVLGLVVGFLNVTGEETQPFLFSSVILIIAATIGQEVMTVIPIFGNILNALLAIFVPATIIVAIKHVFSLARD